MAEALKRVNPSIRIGFVGALSTVDPERCLAATPVLGFAAGSEFDFTIQEIAEICGEMLGGWDMAKRRLREGVEFLSFLNRRRTA